MTNKLKSFTIIELTISLLISSIVITVMYYAFLLFNHQFKKYRAKTSVVNEILLFQKSMQKDFEMADRITDSVAIALIFENNTENYTIRYLRNDDFIIRFAPESMDSFEIKNQNLNIKYVDNLRLLREVAFNLIIDNDILPMAFHKQYSAQQLMTSEVK